MDKRSLRNKKGKHHVSRTHERPNQGILGRVASKVKGLLNPWFFNVWNSASEEEPGCSLDLQQDEESVHDPAPQAATRSSKRPRLRLHEHSSPGCSGNALYPEPSSQDFAPQTSSRGIKRLRLHEHSIPGCSTDAYNEAPQEQDYTLQNSTISSKRQRLRLPDSSILSAGTQTWLDMPDRSNLYGQASHLPPSSAQISLLDNKESSVMMNGDDHSENSEESASTSGCSSLVSHKDRSLILGVNEIKDRRDVASQKGGLAGDMSTSRLSLWSTGASPASRSIRSPSIMQSSQPGFSLSAFVGSSKSLQAERKVSSPFYQGKTTFGGASTSRRMPIAAAPYQVDKPLRDQIKFRSNESKDSYEGMSSAAKRILQTLEKMSSPITDAKKIPNTNKSPVDLSLYLMPPKHRRNLQSTPAGPSRGPPIADISTISKLTTIKNYGQKRFQNSILESPTILIDKPSTVTINMPQVSTPSPSLPSGGGKMRNKLNQQHRPSAKSTFGVSDMESRMSEYIDAIGDTTNLPEIPLPITGLPTIKFGSTVIKSTNDSNQKGKGFVFSNPIEHVVPNSALSSIGSSQTFNSPTSLAATDRKKDSSVKTFTFSKPIEHETSISSSSPMLTSGISFASANPTATWECNSCWVRNPAKETKCQCCEAPNPSRGIVEESRPATSHAAMSKPTFQSLGNFKKTSTWECSSCWIQNPTDKDKCLACEAPNPTSSLDSKPPASLTSTVKSTFEKAENFKKTSTWECSSCWIQNGADEDKCLACENPNPAKANSTDKKPSVTNSFSQQLSPSATGQLTTTSSGFKFTLPSSPASNPGFKFGISSVPDKSAPVSSSTGFKPPESSDGSQTVSFGGFKMPVSKKSTPECITLDNDAVCHSSSVSTSVFSPLSKTVKSILSGSSTKGQVNSNVSNSPLHSAPAKKTDPEVSPSWDCDVCLVRNEADKQKCEACWSLRTNKNLIGFSFIQRSEKSLNSGTNNFINPTSNAAMATTGSSTVSTDSSTPSNTTSILTILSSSKVTPSVLSSTGSESTVTSISSGTVTLPEPATSSAFSTNFQFGNQLSNSEAPKSTTETALSEIKSEMTKELSPFVSQTPASAFVSSDNPLLRKSNDKLAFGKQSENPSEGFSFNTTATTSITTASTKQAFQFGVTTSPNASTWECSICRVKNDVSSQKCSTCESARGPKKSPAIITSKSAAILGFAIGDATSTPAPVFQFGSQVSGSTAPASTSATTNATFSFGSKESTNQLPISQATAPAFGTSTHPIFAGSTTTPAFSKPATEGFSFGAAVSTSATPAVTAPVFQFGSKPSSDASWECSSCHAKTDVSKQNCGACNLPRTDNLSDATVSKSSVVQAFQMGTTASTQGPVFQFGSQPSTNTTSVSTAVATNAKFSFGAKEPANEPPASQNAVAAFGTATTQSMFGNSISGSAFGKMASQPASGGFSFNIASSGSTAPTSTAPVFQFGSTAPSDTTCLECFKLRVKNDSGKQKCMSCEAAQAGKNQSGFSFNKTNEIKPDTSIMKFNAPATACTTSSGFSFNATAPVSTGFVFGVKSEPAAQLFSFGAGAATIPKPALTGFESNPSAAPAFQFGSQPTGSSTAASTTFGAPSNTFAFGAKAETANPLQPSSQIPAFGSAPSQPMFSNSNAAPVFGKPAPAGFSFGMTPSAPVFQFGSSDKKPAASTGFSFGAPTQDAAKFQPQFNMTASPNYKFGGPAAPGPFQFGASSDNTQTVSAPRKIRKAVRRMK